MKRDREDDITNMAPLKREREEKNNDEAMGDADGQEKPDVTEGGGAGNSAAAPDLLAPQEGDCIVYVSTLQLSAF